MLAVLYSGVVGHVRQAVSPSSENWPAAQRPHTMSAVATQVEVPSQTVPAAHAVAFVQASQGIWPLALHVAPAVQPDATMHVSDSTSQ